MKSALFFAYGSTLDLTPGKLAGEATLRGWRPGLAGQTLVPDRQGLVHGHLLAMPVTMLDLLDGNDGWLRTRRRVRVEDGRRPKAWVYLRPEVGRQAEVA